jgi:hypothetical protein
LLPHILCLSQLNYPALENAAAMSQSIQAKAHLVGSFPSATAEAAMRTTSRGLKDLLISIPDGETGWRYYFTVGLFQKIAAQYPELGGVWRGYDEQLSPLPVPEVSEKEKKSLLDTIASHPDLDFGYAEEALQSYQTFLQLRQDGAIGKNVRFQICLPGVGSFGMFIVPHYQRFMENLAFRSLQNDVIKIAKKLPAADLAIQFDIAADFIMMEAQKDASCLETLRADFHPRSEDLKAFYSAHYVELIGLVDLASTVGLHICPGNIGNKAVIEPKDMSLSVELANTIMDRIDRPLQWVHFGILPSWKDESHYAPLKGLQPGPAVYLGLVYPDDKEGAEQRMYCAHQHLQEFGIAPQCGLGRASAEDAGSVLKIISELSGVSSDEVGSKMASVEAMNKEVTIAVALGEEVGAVV